MPPKRFPTAVVVWLAGLPTLAALAWLSGYLYWQMQISRAITDVKREPGKYTSEPHAVNPELLRIGSRGIPRFMRELDLALSRGDDEQAFAMTCGLIDMVAGCFQHQGSVTKRVAEDRLQSRSREAMKEILRDYGKPDLQKILPPWWRWWSGTLRPED